MKRLREAFVSFQSTDAAWRRGKSALEELMTNTGVVICEPSVRDLTRMLCYFDFSRRCLQRY